MVIEVDAKGKGADEAFSLVPDPEPARQLTIAGQLKSSRYSAHWLCKTILTNDYGGE